MGLHWARLSFSGHGQRDDLMGHETGEKTGEEIQEKIGEEPMREGPAGSETPPATTYRARWTHRVFVLLESLVELQKFMLGVGQDAISNVSLLLVLGVDPLFPSDVDK
jgi:hypothetical protein